jgi:hypothetical protein
MSTFAESVISFYQSLKPPSLPDGIDLLYPQQDPQVMGVVKLFFRKYYSDDHPRRLIFGINPGRFGAGTTGINFTAPKQLSEYCGIEHSFKPQSELSAEFIYKMIEAYGGPSTFYHDYFISSISPLGFTKDKININYYDDPALYEAVKPFIVDSIKKQLRMNVITDKTYCIGGDKNLKFLSRINGEFQFFKEIIPLPHPRFIMQYRRKHLDQYIKAYLLALKNP